MKKILDNGQTNQHLVAGREYLESDLGLILCLPEIILTSLKSHCTSLRISFPCHEMVPSVLVAKGEF